MLAKAKQRHAVRRTPKSDTWQLVPADEISGRQHARKTGRADAKRYLERVVKRTPGHALGTVGRSGAQATVRLDLERIVHRRERAAAGGRRWQQQQPPPRNDRANMIPKPVKRAAETVATREASAG